MAIIDSQVHAYEANTPRRPWHTVPNWPAHVTGDEMIAAMDEVGVDGAIFISAFSMYRYDARYAVEVHQAHPGRFGLVKPVDPDDPAVAEVIAEWQKTPGAVGVRIMMPKEAGREPYGAASFQVGDNITDVQPMGSTLFIADLGNSGSNLSELSGLGR